jgi:hypothetical protein
LSFSDDLVPGTGVDPSANASAVDLGRIDAALRH